MRFTRSISVLVAAFTAALLGLTLAPTAAHAESIQVEPTTTVAAKKGPNPRQVYIADCGPHPEAGCYGKRLWAKFAVDPLSPKVKIKVFVKRGGKWRKHANVKTKGNGLTKKVYVRAINRKKTKYKVVAKGDAVWAKATTKFTVYSRR
ncbi:hypothetical protein [Nocardioides humi]|uniref:Uncharacterized protein n=1 Tax=Nocardioides humi TaxID=449461 RepID=A0ABN2A1N4_9ACTN|nr:hypothetical protein [Nocardioides humi]